MRSILRLAILLAAIGAAPALAQGTAQQRSNCTDDAFRFCNAEIPDAFAVEKCLRSNMSRLGRACRREFAGPTKKSKQRARRR
jgi:hypothetical protein